MPINTYPLSNTGGSSSTTLPLGASSVLYPGAALTTVTSNAIVSGTSSSSITYTAAGLQSVHLIVGGSPVYVSPNLAVGVTTASGTTLNIIGSPSATFSSIGSYGNNNMGYVGYFETCAFSPLNNTFVAINTNSSSQGVYSTNGGASWTGMTMPVSAYWTGLTWGNGIFVAVAGGANNVNYVATSTNGYTWTSYTNSASVPWQDVAYGQPIATGVNTWVSVCGYGRYGGSASSNTASYSTNNGQTWTTSTLPYSTAWYNVEFGNGIFMINAGGWYSGINYLATSTNGYTWTGLTNNAGSYLWAGLAFGVISGTGQPMWFQNTSNNQNVGAYSTNNGASWTRSDGSTQSSYGSRVAFGGGMWISPYFNNNQGYGYTSNPANGWNIVNVSYQPDAVAYGNGTFVMPPANNQQFATVLSGSINVPSVFSLYNGPTTTF